MRRVSAAWISLALIAGVVFVAPADGQPVTRYLDKSYGLVPALTLQAGFDGSVVPIEANWHGVPTPSPSAGAPGLCANGASNKACNEFVPVPAVVDINGNSLKVSATSAGLIVTFKAEVPFVSTSGWSCTQLHAVSSGGARLASIVARTGRRVGERISYDGGRAECDFGTGFAYALSVEKQSLSNIVPAGAAGDKKFRTLTIPWKTLALTVHSSSIMVALNVCTGRSDCEPAQVVVEIPVRVVDTAAALSVEYAPYVRVPQTPAPGATPQRLHDVGVDGSFSWDQHDLALASYNQDQSTVASQRALSQAISLTPLSVPMSGQMPIAQTLQTRSQPLFSFSEVSQRLNDDSLKPLFDLVPYSVSKVGTLASGYTYGYSSQAVKFAALYGNQAQGWYTGAETVTLALTTPPPSPEPSLPPFVAKTAAVEAIPLKAPPPPAPFFESSTANDLPAQVTLLNGYSGSKGVRDNVNALAANAHVYQNESATYAGYQATTLDVFGRLIQDRVGPDGRIGAATTSQFGGESASFTTSSAPPNSAHPDFFQVKETLGAQVDERFFAPSAGSTTWVTPLSGPVAHLTASYAGGDSARYFALDVIGFRLTDIKGDVATQEGVQASLPVPHLTGWILTGGSLTQTVSDRIAVLEQGLVSNYANALVQVVPTPNPKTGSVPETQIRPQHLDNGSLLSPWIPLTFPAETQIQLVGGYNFGSVTGCGTTPKSTAKKPLYACQTQQANHGVGGLFFRVGNLWSFGATDTSALPGSISAGGASRNLGTSGGLPGSVTGFLSYGGCPRISAAYTNAAFPSGVPLPQQGNTFSAEVDYPILFHKLQLDAAIGAFNEHPVQNSGPATSGGFLAFRLTAAHPRVDPCAP